ncbi:MAG TPA: DoxX family protein [Terriglobales bacterium]
MQTAAPVAAVSNKTMWVGRVVSLIPAVLVLFGAIMKLIKADAVVVGMAQHGIPEHLVVLTGAIESLCAIVYLIPRTAVLGAILMTALFGGATFTNVRVGDPTWVVTVVLGVMVWAGLYLRDTQLRELIPLRKRY